MAEQQQVNLGVIVNDFLSNIIMTLNLRALVKVYNNKADLETLITEVYAENWKVFSEVMNKYFAQDLQSLMTIKVHAQESFESLKAHIMSAWDEEHKNGIVIVK
jgi:hypothetical protein